MGPTNEFRDCVPRYLGRNWRATDGCTTDRVEACEARLQHRLPESLRALYLSVGDVPELCTAHNLLLSPGEVSIVNEHLVFMEENQSVVSWGVPLAHLHERNPTVWQRNNTAPVEWFSEGKSVLELMTSMWEWYVEIGLLAKVG